MKTIQITDSIVMDKIISSMPVATKTNKGLMSNNDFMSVGNMADRNIDDIGNSYGYSYQSDGSGIAGPFISFTTAEFFGLQIKSAYDASIIIYRSKDPTTKQWTSWKKFKLL